MSWTSVLSIVLILLLIGVFLASRSGRDDSGDPGAN
jgi:hypothetical protein